MESIFEKADFTAGSDHKERLRKVLFSDIKNNKGEDSAEKLRDEELDMAAGFGFLALAVMIFGQWKPTRIALAALLFGLFRALSNTYAGFPFLVSLNLPGNVYNMMPYIVCLIVLAFTSKASHAPKAEGIPYDKGSR